MLGLFYVRLLFDVLGAKLRNTRLSRGSTQFTTSYAAEMLLLWSTFTSRDVVGPRGEEAGEEITRVVGHRVLILGEVEDFSKRWFVFVDVIKQSVTLVE